MWQAGLMSRASFCFCSTIQSSICFRIPLSVHSLWAFRSLSISALIIALSPGESMAQKCTLPHKQVKPAVASLLLLSSV
jgi:hypothetical protein